MFTRTRRAVAAFGLAIAAPVALVAPAPAFAQANYATLTAAVDFSSVITALMAVAALVAGVLIVRKGIRFVLGAIR